MVEKGPRWSEMFWDGQRLSEIFLIWSVDIMRGSRMVQDFQDALKWEEMNIASTMPVRRRLTSKSTHFWPSSPSVWSNQCFFFFKSFQCPNRSIWSCGSKILNWFCGALPPSLMVFNKRKRDEARFIFRDTHRQRHTESSILGGWLHDKKVHFSPTKSEHVRRCSVAPSSEKTAKRKLEWVTFWRPQLSPPTAHPTSEKVNESESKIQHFHRLSQLLLFSKRSVWMNEKAKHWERWRDFLTIPFTLLAANHIQHQGGQKYGWFATHYSQFHFLLIVSVFVISNYIYPSLVICWLRIVPWKVSSQNWQSIHCFLPDQLWIILQRTELVTNEFITDNIKLIESTQSIIVKQGRLEIWPWVRSKMWN